MAYREDGKDYCSLFPDYLFSIWKFRRVYIGSYCKLHDELYEKHKNKFVADRKLLVKVFKDGLPVWAIIMYIGVSTAGWYWYIKAGKNEIK